MCGIAGQISRSDSRERLAGLLPRLQAALFHRGPDDQGIHISRGGYAGMISTRLAILDLTTAGHQPMQSADGQHVIVFNGEIYNFRALAASLEEKGVKLNSHSDTEVVLQLYRLRGVDCLRELRGMFAFAIWDDFEKTCFLARDPLGIKPLYYFLDAPGTLTFASELQALRSTGAVATDLEVNALGAYLRQGSVPEPLTLLRGVRSLEAGHWLKWQAGNIDTGSYWSLPFFNDHRSEPALVSGDDIAAVRAALVDSLEHHFVSDVPVGLFLSGGIDSTALLALAHAQGHDALSTYSLSFDDEAFNEGDLARRTAEHFGSNHVDHRLSGAEAKQMFSEFLRRMDQPSVDGFNTFAVSRVAHAHGAKVVLSGLGGDEMFGGYPSFTRVPWLLRFGRMPSGLRGVVAGALQTWPGHPRIRRLGEFLARDVTVDSAMSAMRGIFTQAETDALVRHFVPDAESMQPMNPTFGELSPHSLPDAVSAHELTHYMRNQLLRDSDVASMAWSLELRVPLVDRQLLSIVARVPADRRLRPGKAMLREAVPEIPPWIAHAGKRGFTLPLEQWLREDWHDLFGESANEIAGVQPRTWYQHWCLFVFRNWMENSTR